ncbi:MAG TPA: DNA polymerase III subunit delta' [Steroidobacteraceae bacterium]|jgi:DNA polymerase III, delta'' subunit|nr:DNA polymerase III subunit delta' [Steroidobacteraceae bacterium]HJY35822.1 DNA polymerase III subunit delta' [Steroidobacteraceae bacterium]
MTDTPERTLPQLLPWQEEPAAQLRKAWSANRLSHALLLQGAEGLGKQSFAAWLACAVLCDKSAGATLRCCGECASCALFAAGSHPDLLWVVPEEDKQQISIDQVRSATERLTKTSYRQGYKVAIVNPAHLMTPSAANSVLKTLEEPSPRSLLIVITSQPSMLLPTVRSRCQKVTITRPSREQAIAWLREKSGRAVDSALLEFAGGAPLRALAYADGRFDALNEHMQKSLGALLAGDADVTQVAAEWGKDGLEERLTWLDLWLSSLARAVLAGTADLVTFPGRSAHLPSPSRPLNISGVYSMVDRARALRSQLARTALQRELAVESWLIALLDVFGSEPSKQRA